MVDENIPSFIIIDGKEYWINSSRFSGCVVFIESTHFGSCNMITNKYSVRPVINLKKSAIESTCPTH